MSDAITVSCPSCKASLKLKNRNSVGKKVPCPKCKKPFVVKAPAAEDDDLAFMNARESDGAIPMAEDEDDEFAAAQPVRSTSRSSGGKKMKGKGKASSEVNWVKPLLIGVAALVFVGLLVGGGIVAVSMIGGRVQNKIDLAYLPPNADLVVHIRVDEVLGSQFMQTFTAKAEFKQFTEQLTSSFQVPLADVKSITIGAVGASRVDVSKLMTMPGMGSPRHMESLRGISSMIVIRTSKDLPSDLMSKLPHLEKFEYGGKTYYRPTGRTHLSEVCVFPVTPQVLVLGNSMDMTRLIDSGLKQTRRPEFDFVEPGSQIVFAFVNQGGPGADPATPGGSGTKTAEMPVGAPGGMPGGPMGTNALPALSNGKVKAWYLGITFNQDIEIQAGLNCSDSAADVKKELEGFIAQQKTQLAAQKEQQTAMLNMVGMGDLMAQIESLINSLSVSGTGSVAQVNAKIPGGIRTSIEKGISMMSTMAAGAAGGLGEPNPFGAQPADATQGDGSTSSPGDSGSTPNSSNPTPPQ